MRPSAPLFPTPSEHRQRVGPAERPGEGSFERVFTRHGFHDLVYAASEFASEARRVKVRREG